MIEPAYAFAALMFAISLGTLIFSVVQFKNKASSTYVDKLEDRIRTLEKDHATCEQALKHASEKNFELMKEIIAITAKAADNSAAQIAQSGLKIERLDSIYGLVNGRFEEAMKTIAAQRKQIEELTKGKIK